jgi:hypothetical protein
MIPGVKGANVATKEEARAFHESERNCNTCRDLQRVPHPKHPAGFLYGHCLHHPYGTRWVMMFHPDDHLGMKCYTPRWQD